MKQPYETPSLHTHGWTFDAERGEIRDSEGNVLAVVPHAIAGDESDLANGRLMAKAPMLAILLGKLAEALDAHHDGTAYRTGGFERVWERDEALLQMAREALND